MREEEKTSSMRGVHLEEPTSPLGQQWGEDLDGFVKQLSSPKISINRLQPVNMHQSDRQCRREAERQMKELSRDMRDKCTTNCVIDKINDTFIQTEVVKQSKKLGHKKSKETPKPRKSSSETDDTNDMSVSSNCDDEGCDVTYHSPSGENSKVVFDCDSTPENSDENSSKSPEKEIATFYNKKEKDSKRRRFRRMITRPLRRSHSAGCEKDIPAHALFLQYNAKDRNMDSMESRALELSGGSLSPEGEDETTPLRRAVHKTCSADAAMMASEELPGSHTVHPKSKSRNLARNMKRKLQFLRRRNTDSALGAALMKTEANKLPPEQAQQWSRSFESLLTDKSGLELFRGFLRSEFSEENIEFWIACEELKTCKANKVTVKAHKIYSDFVAVQAPKEINLDSKTRIQAISNLVNPSRDVFEKAQKRIQGLMEKDSYPRFLQSDIYLQLTTKEEKS